MYQSIYFCYNTFEDSSFVVSYILLAVAVKKEKIYKVNLVSVFMYW